MFLLVFDTGSRPAELALPARRVGQLRHPWDSAPPLALSFFIVRRQEANKVSRLHAALCPLQGKKKKKKKQTLQLPLLHLGQALAAAYSAETDSKLRSQHVLVCWRHRFFCQMLYLKSLRLRFRNVATQCYIILAFSEACFNPTCQIPPKFQLFVHIAVWETARRKHLEKGGRPSKKQLEGV